MIGSNFFTFRTSTLDVALVDVNGLVYYAKCTGTPPTTANLFQHGAIIVQTNSTTGTNAMFQNTGSSASPVWSPFGAAYIQSDVQTIATTSNTDTYIIAPKAGVLSSATFSGIDALATSDTNYITFSITNLGQAGAGSTAMLASSPAGTNTTKATGGTAIAANTKYALTVHGTAANLVVAAGDRLRIRYAATGTLANTVTGSTTQLLFV